MLPPFPELLLTAESTVKGNIAAYVTDPSGATVSDAKVTLVGPTGEKALTTGSDGKVLFQILTPGTYSVKIEKAGFKTDDVKSVEVEVGKTSVVNAKLETNDIVSPNDAVSAISSRAMR